MAGAPWWEQFDPGESVASAASTRSAAGPGAPTGAGGGPRPGTGTAAPPEPQVVVHEPRPPRPPRGLQAVAAVLALLLVALLGVLAARTVGASDRSPTGPATADGPTTSPVRSATGGTAAADAAATAELEDLRRRGLQEHPPQGQWVAQLAAKSVGTTDPVQTAANGSSTFYATDILAQSREIASGIAGGDVFVLRTTDFGDGLVDARGNPYWVTLVAGPFGDADDVRTWCDSVFATVPAADRSNACLPKQLTPPS
ncbi:hypothetical protein AB2L28_20120 [Kineococcus sp. TBRC 1896]|uniref:Uncharacterized protein n=1 Tax=Kineococcus mangrovi TaxID=1660183 RepID=A0ABV4I788_9ACTN